MSTWYQMYLNLFAIKIPCIQVKCRTPNKETNHFRKICKISLVQENNTDWERFCSLRQWSLVEGNQTSITHDGQMNKQTEVISTSSPLSPCGGWPNRAQLPVVLQLSYSWVTGPVCLVTLPLNVMQTYFRYTSSFPTNSIAMTLCFLN